MVIFEFKLPAPSSFEAINDPDELNKCMYGSLIDDLYMYNVTEVPGLMPFSTHVSQGLLRGLRPPVPLPEIVVVDELTADATFAVNKSIASEAAMTEINERAVKRIADERRARDAAALCMKHLFLLLNTTNSAQKLYVQNLAEGQCG